MNRLKFPRVSFTSARLLNPLISILWITFPSCDRLKCNASSRNRLHVHSSSFVVQRLHPQEPRGPSQLFFDSQQLVVLGNSVGARSRAGLNLPHAGGYRK